MRATRSQVPGFCLAALGFAGTAAAADTVEAGSGLLPSGWASPAAVSDGVTTASPLRGRLSLGLNAPAAGLAPVAVPASVVSARLLGDYYFGQPVAGERRASGFRATSGVLFGSRLAAWASMPSATLGSTSLSVDRRNVGLLPGALDTASRGDGGTVPYLGIGYSDAFAKGRWGITADLGVMALRPAGNGLRPGRAAGLQSSDDALRDLRLSPVLQLGVSYSF